MEQNLLDIISDFGNKQISEVGIFPLAALISLSLLCSFFVSYLYIHFYKQRSTGSEIYRCFPLLGVSITAIFICIQFSLPLSLGLLGALSIVRFRTPIKEPEEIGFLMLLIATSISCATFNIIFLSVLLLVASAGLLILKYFSDFLDVYISSGVIMLTIPKNLYEDKLQELLDIISTNVPGCRIDSMSTKGEEAIITINFHKMNNNGLTRFTENVRAFAEMARIDVFYNEQGNTY